MTLAKMTPSALPHWLAQRATAAFMAAYSFIAIGVVFVNAPFTYETWQSMFGSTWVRWTTALFALSLAWHAAIGIHDVLKDYIKPAGVRFVFLMFGYFVLGSFLIQTISALWR